MKVWIGGATGFLGAHATMAALAAGHEVAAISRSGGKVTAGSDGATRTLAVQPTDILDEGAVCASAQGTSYALLCAGMVSREPADAERLQRLHVDGTRSALRGLRAAGVTRVVVVSTSGTLAVSDDPKCIGNEEADSPLELISGWPYYRSKHYAEQVALAENQPGFEVIIANPSLLLGPGDLRESSTIDVRRFLEGSLTMSPAGGLAFVDVRDVAQGLLSALERGRGGERYLMNAANMTFSAFFARLARQSGVRAPLFKAPANKELALGLFALYDGAIRSLGGRTPIERHEVELSSYYWYCSSAKAERELGFAPRDAGETLRDTVQDLVARQVVAPRAMRKRG